MNGPLRRVSLTLLPILRLDGTGREDREIEGKVNHSRLRRAGAVATIGVVLFLFACVAQSFAQGLGGFGQLLGGGSGGSSRHQQQNSSQPNAVTVSGTSRLRWGNLLASRKRLPMRAI
jgi:hypothetical protein